MPLLKIGCMGSASGPTLKKPGNVEKCRKVGEEIAYRGFITVTGACPGLPDEAAKGAKKNGGFVFGMSPAFSLAEHIKTYKSPVSHYDMICYSGLGLMERDILNIRSCDAVIFLGGGVGTLNEFTVAYEEGKILGILKGTGGLSEHIPEILKMVDKNAEERPGLFIEEDPIILVDKVSKAMLTIPHPYSEDAFLGFKG